MGAGGTGWVLAALAALLGALHAVAPDHWLPLALMARSGRWSAARTARVSLLAALGHVLASLALGVPLVYLWPRRAGLQFSEERLMAALIGLSGAGLLLWQVAPRRRRLRGAARPQRSLGALAVPLGVAASPNLAVAPLLAAAEHSGPFAGLAALLAFAAATALAFVVLATLAAAGGRRLRLDWVEAHGELLAGLLLLGIGAYAWLTA